MEQETKKNDFDLTKPMTITLPTWLFVMIPFALLYTDNFAIGYIIWLAILIDSQSKEAKAQLDKKTLKLIVLSVLGFFALVAIAAVVGFKWDQIVAFMKS